MWVLYVSVVVRACDKDSDTWELGSAKGGYKSTALAANACKKVTMDGETYEFDFDAENRVIKLGGTAGPAGVKACLELTIAPSLQEAEMALDPASCNLARRGMKLVHIAHVVARDFGVRVLTAHDGSYLRCDKCDKGAEPDAPCPGTSFPVFRLLTKGETWYESAGFAFSDKVRTHEEEVDARCRTTIPPDMIEACDFFDRATHDLRAEGLRAVGAMAVPSEWSARCEKSDTCSVGQYLAELWEKDCMGYEEKVSQLTAPGHDTLSLVYVGTKPDKADEWGIMQYRWGIVHQGLRKEIADGIPRRVAVVRQAQT